MRVGEQLPRRQQQQRKAERGQLDWVEEPPHSGLQMAAGPRPTWLSTRFNT